MVQGANMLDLVVKVEHLEGIVRVTTNSGTTDYPLDATVEAHRSVRRPSTGDYLMIPVR